MYSRRGFPGNFVDCMMLHTPQFPAIIGKRRRHAAQDSTLPAAPLLKAALLSLLAASSVVALPCVAAPEEIQVYMDDMSAPGQFGLDVHNNYVISGTTTPSYPGELPTEHVYRLTPEFYYGLTKTLELGFYVLTTDGAGDSVHTDGAKVRLKYVAPHDAETGFYWGLNLEIGRTDLRVSELPWNAELRPSSAIAAARGASRSIPISMAACRMTAARSRPRWTARWPTAFQKRPSWASNPTTSLVPSPACNRCKKTASRSMPWSTTTSAAST